MNKILEDFMKKNNNLKITDKEAKEIDKILLELREDIQAFTIKSLRTVHYYNGQGFTHVDKK